MTLRVVQFSLKIAHLSFCAAADLSGALSLSGILRLRASNLSELQKVGFIYRCSGVKLTPLRDLK